MFWVGELEVAGEDFPKKPCGDKEAEDCGEDDEKGGGLLGDGGDIPCENGGDECGDDEGEQGSGAAEEFFKARGG